MRRKAHYGFLTMQITPEIGCVVQYSELSHMQMDESFLFVK